MIWLVGADGMLGREVRGLLEARALSHVATDVELDITERDQVSTFVLEHAPAWVVNCAAYTAVDRAESEEERAFAVNATGPENLARAAASVDARLIHVSTDYVFAGQATEPYPEDAPIRPLGAYGRSKAAGELAVREHCSRHIIVRTAWLHGPHGPNFAATMLRLLAERPELKVVDDQLGSPTYAADLAEALMAFVEQGADEPGTYHFTNEGTCSWHAFAEQIQTQGLALGLLERTVSIRPIPSSEFPTPAPRPAWSVLSKDRIRAALGLSIPTWQDGLERHLRRLKEQP